MPITAIPPHRMTAAERLDEVASILAAGIARLAAKEAARRQAAKTTGERSFGLDFGGDERLTVRKTGDGERT